MKIDIIGSTFSSRLTEFRNFPYDVNIFVAGQSFLSLLSKPYPVAMKDINTSDIVKISTAHRDLNKANLGKLQESRSEVLMIDLLSELNPLVKYNGSYFNKESFELINENIEYEELRKIDQFKALKKHIDKIIELTSFYNQVILLNVTPGNEHDDFINGLYEILYNCIDNKLVISADTTNVKDIFNAPIEAYDSIVQQLRKFNSDNYENQLLFDEKLNGDILSVYMNYIEPRHYIYELYKDGKPYKKSHSTDSRYCQFKLDKPGKYRIRVNPESETVKARFSKIYEYKSLHSENCSYKYIEMPSENQMWAMNLYLRFTNINAVIGNPYKYPNGYKGFDVLMPNEVSEDYIKKVDILDGIDSIIDKLNKNELSDFINENEVEFKKASEFINNYFNFILDSK